jgi:hypothetical protein
MMAIAFLFGGMLGDSFKSRQRLEAEILVLRHQLNVLQQRAPRRVHLHWASRALFIWLYRCCPRILDAITIVRPETVVRWHRMGFAAYLLTTILRIQIRGDLDHAPGEAVCAELFDYPTRIAHSGSRQSAAIAGAKAASTFSRCAAQLAGIYK